MQFHSDNWSGAHPEIAHHLQNHSTGFAQAYGNSELDQKVRNRFHEIFEREVEVYFVTTGTASNALAITTFDRPGGVAFAYRESHLMEDECGAAQHYTGGGRLRPVDGSMGRIDPLRLEMELARMVGDSLHSGIPTVASLTQASEVGTVYSGKDIGKLAAICRQHDVGLHMDGARFANALVATGLSPADMTWRNGVDILSFGGTKNGCWCAEALVIFNQELARDLPILRKRAGQLVSKSRFIAAQFDAYLHNNLWLDLATHANQCAQALSSVVDESNKLTLAWPAEANEVFAFISRDDACRLRSAGAGFNDWRIPHWYREPEDQNQVLIRMVTSFATTQDDLEHFRKLVC